MGSRYTLHICEPKGAKDRGLYKEGVPLPELADTACPVQGTGKASAGVRCSVLVPD